jgi:hypothetical protein
MDYDMYYVFYRHVHEYIKQIVIDLVGVLVHVRLRVRV